eukprot:1833978-Amphidinium_carterae.1
MLSRERTSPGYGTFGINDPLLEAWLSRPTSGRPNHGGALNQRHLFQSSRPLLRMPGCAGNGGNPWSGLVKPKTLGP